MPLLLRMFLIGQCMQIRLFSNTDAACEREGQVTEDEHASLADPAFFSQPAAQTIFNLEDGFEFLEDPWQAENFASDSFHSEWPGSERPTMAAIEKVFRPRPDELSTAEGPWFSQPPIPNFQ
jgi:hypothetical protein